MTDLSPRRHAILSFIQERTLIHGQPPSLAEIATACGLASRGAARLQVLALAEAGLIELTPGQARGIRPAGSASRRDALSVPILGRVAAGVPIGADAELVDTLSLDVRLFSQRPDYLLRVQGDSMIEAGIFDGDTVIIRNGNTANPGDIIVALVDDEEATLKRFRRKGTMIALEAANPAYETRVFPDHLVKVQGRLVGLIRSY